MSIAFATVNGDGQMHSPVRWRRRGKSPSPVTASVVSQPQLHHQQSLLLQPPKRPRSLHAYRRSDPGLLGTMVMDVELNDEGDVIDSQWNVSRAAVTSCGVGRSASLRNSFIRPKEPMWLLSKLLQCLVWRVALPQSVYIAIWYYADGR